MRNPKEVVINSKREMHEFYTIMGSVYDSEPTSITFSKLQQWSIVVDKPTSSPSFVNQKASFVLRSKSAEDYLRSQAWLGKPAQRVRQLAFEIDVCGFRKGDIFPDLEHLALELTGRFRPRA